MKRLSIATVLLAVGMFFTSSVVSPRQARADGTIGFLVLDIVTETWELWFVQESMLVGGSAAATEGQIAALGADIMGPLLQAEIIPLGAEGAAGTAGGAAGGTALGTAGILTGAVVVAVVATIGIDYAINGNFFWEPVNEAGGFGVVLGLRPNPNLGTNPSYTTVSCNPAAGSVTNQCRQALSNNLTEYYSWFGGSYWTCGDMWNSSGSSSLWTQEMSKCDAALSQCVAATNTTCGVLQPQVQVVTTSAP